MKSTHIFDTRNRSKSLFKHMSLYMALFVASFVMLLTLPPSSIHALVFAILGLGCLAKLVSFDQQLTGPLHEDTRQ